MSKNEVKNLANAIVSTLFINGNGDEAKRLVLEMPDGNYGGGWGKEPARDVIQEKILEWLKEIPEAQ